MTEELLPLADFARSLVVSCGARLGERRRSISPAMREKGSYRDNRHRPTDLWVQEYLLSRLLARWPDHGVLGEEGARRQGTSPWTWVLDPIDGTTNYYQAGRGCAISLGLLYRGEPVWGLVLDISSGKAREGSIPYGPERPGSLAPHQAVLHLGVRTMESLAALGGDAYHFARQFQGVRYFGCASLELCSVAEERGGVYVNSHLKLWGLCRCLGDFKIPGLLHRRGSHGGGGLVRLCGHQPGTVPGLPDSPSPFHPNKTGENRRNSFLC